MTSDEPGPAESTQVDATPEAAGVGPGPEPIVAAEEGPAEVELVVPPPVVEAVATDEITVEPELDFETTELAEEHASILLALAELGASLGRRIDTLAAAFDREVRAESTREKVVDRLHAELQEYKNDLLLNVMRPVFVDLIQLHDDIGKIVAAQSEREGSDEVARLVDLMRGFQQGVEDILYRQGVEPFTLDDDAFDPRRQRAFSTVPTDDPGQAKRVAARLRKGFRAGEKVIRPEIVSVYAARRD
jgi:molecular chaperone GrpE